MSLSVGKKLSLYVALLTSATIAAVGYVSLELMERNLSASFRQETLDTARLLASRVEDEFAHTIEKGRALTLTALTAFGSPVEQTRFLERGFAGDERVAAFSVFKQGLPLLRVHRVSDKQPALSETDFRDLDAQYPIDLEAKGPEVAVGRLPDGTPSFRVVFPLETTASGAPQVGVLELRQDKFTEWFAQSTAYFSFLVDRNGRVLAQTEATHFTPGEDLSHLRVFQVARAERAANAEGSVDYSELPGSLPQYAGFYKMDWSGLTVISQASREQVTETVRAYVRQALTVAGAGVVFVFALTWLGAWGMIGARLRRLTDSLRKLRADSRKPSFPEQEAGDEIGELAQELQHKFALLEGRGPTGTFAKAKTRRSRSRGKAGKLSHDAERVKAIVLYCHLRGIEEVVTQSDPELLISLLNPFNAALTQAVERNQGSVDYARGGSLLAFWGIPTADKDHADFALGVCLEARKLAQELNAELKQRGLPEIHLAIGLHHGYVIAAQVHAKSGSAASGDERAQPTIFGDAVDLATRIQSFTEQFSTDVLLTGAIRALAPAWYSLDQLSPGDEHNPELYELMGRAEQASVEDPSVESAAA